MAAEDVAIISTPVACQLLMLSRQRIDQLVKEGYIRKRGPGQFALVDVVQGYIRFLKNEERRGTKNASDNRVRDARALEIELRTMQKMKQLLPLPFVLEVIDKLCGMVRSEFSGFAAAATRDLAMRRIIDREVYARLERVAKAASSEALRLETDSSQPVAVASDGAGRMGGSEQDVSA